MNKAKKPKKSMAEKYPTRQALVYSGAAFLILIVGFRSILTVAEEGFGIVEYITIGGLLLEFSMLLMYAYTIYAAGKETMKEMRAEKEAVSEGGKEVPPVKPEDIPEILAKISLFAEKSGEISRQLAQNHEAIEKHSQILSNFTEKLDKIIEENVALKVRQEIHRILSETINPQK